MFDLFVELIYCFPYMFLWVIELLSFEGSACFNEKDDMLR